jgi:N-acetyl-anhydromuramyl-L-alanine amidase AmpD
MRTISQIIIHCAYTTPSMDVGVNEITRWHVQDRGFSDIGYHFVIRRDGTIETGRDVNEPGAHAKGHNANSLGVCLVGGMSADGKPDSNYTREQWDALRALVEALVDMHGVKEVVGHRDVSNKPCPCFDVKEWWNYDSSPNRSHH